MKNIMVIYACILIVSCGENRIDKTLDCVENIVVSYPDSALMLLDSIKNPYKLTNFQRARHAILTVYAKDLTDKDITRDTMVINARDYLKTVDNPKYLAFAEYYLGRMYQAQDRNEHALKLYLDAKANAEHSDDDDDDIKGLIYSHIGQLYYVQIKYEKAIDNFKPALKHFNKSQENHKRKMAVLNNIGNCFLLNGIKDSAMVYYNESLRLAKTAQDSANVTHNLGMAYLQINELNNAKQQLFLALNLNSDPVTQSSIYLNMSRIYTNKNIDSAVYFAKLSESTSTIRKDIHVLSANYQILSQLEEKKGNHREALYYNRQYTACSNRIKNENVLNIQEIETKHELYRLQNKPSYYGVIILCSCLVCVFCVFCVFILGHIYRKKYATMQTSTDEANRKIAELENSTGKMHLIIIELKNNIEKILSKLNENEELMVLYYTILGNIYNSINKLSFDIDFKRMVNNDKNNNRGKDIVTYLQTMLNKVNTWDIVYTTGKSTFDEIQKMYPLLTDREFKITCLAFLGYTNTTIANALNLKDNTVQHDRSIIRNKLGIEPKGDIPSIIRKQLKK